MLKKYLNIESVSEDEKNKVKQTLKFKTGQFVWRVKFSAPLSPATVNNRNLYVTSLNQIPLKTHIRYNTIDQYIEIEPLEAYSPNESYVLTITTKVKSSAGQHLKKEVQIQFKI